MKRAASLLVCGLAMTMLVGAADRVAPSGNRAGNRAEFVGSLFSGKEQYENFDRIDELFPVAQVPASSRPRPWPRGKSIALPRTVVSQGQPLDVQRFLKETDTAALLVIKDGKVRYEHYWLTGSAQTHWLSMSLAKGFISALLGTVVSDGRIASLSDPVTRYLPELKGSGYDGVAIKDILQMSSGAGWNEDYSDQNAPIFRLSQLMATGGSYAAFPATLPPDLKPGTFNRYNSTDTMVLGLLLERVTGMSISKLTHDRLWEPLGATSNGFWLTDDKGMAMAFGGLNATARDYARLGELYRLGGAWDGQRILPESWVTQSITPDAPHLRPGKRPNSDSDMGYGYQWWIPGGTSDTEFTAIGIYNQFIYVNRTQRTVIVKLSANSSYGLTNDDTSWREHDHMALFRTISAIR